MKKTSMIFATLVILAAPSLSFARQGADDGAGHVRQEDRSTSSSTTGASSSGTQNDDNGMKAKRKNRRNDDGPGHTSISKTGGLMQLARNGADDGAGHVRGEGAGHP